MVKRRQEEPPPLELPPAKLFLDDLEELVRLFTEAVKREELLPVGEVPKVSYQIGMWECDAIEDLKDFGQMKKRDQFQLKIKDLQELTIAQISTYRGRFAWSGSYSFSTTSAWALYGQLHTLLKKRELPWYSRRRSAVIFENSFEHKGLLPSIKRHGTTILVGIASAVGALLAREGGIAMWHYLHHSKIP
jgi:hypothetical protein